MYTMISNLYGFDVETTIGVTAQRDPYVVVYGNTLPVEYLEEEGGDPDGDLLFCTARVGELGPVKRFRYSAHRQSIFEGPWGLMLDALRAAGLSDDDASAEIKAIAGMVEEDSLFTAPEDEFDGA